MFVFPFIRIYICKYVCSARLLVMLIMCVLTGLPGNISNVNIQSDSITACGFVVQWSEPSSNPACDLVVYTVTISTEGGLWIITDNTTMTHHAVTGLSSNTQYIISVTASNNAGSSNSSSDIMMMTSSDGEFVRPMHSLFCS